MESEEFGLFLNVSKTKVMIMMIVNLQEENTSIHAGNLAIEILNQFNFLRTMISNQGRCSIESRAEALQQERRSD